MRVILSITTVALISVSLISFAWLAEGNTRKALTNEIETRLVLEARNLASLSVDALLTEFPELTLCPLVKELQTGRPDLAFVVVLDHEGKIQGHIDLAELNGECDQISGLKEQSGKHLLLTGEKILGNKDLLVASVPAQHATGRVVGSALVGLNQAYLDEIITRPRRSFMFLTLGLLFAGITVTLLMVSRLLAPVAALRSGLERIGRGNLDTDIKLKARTELGQLAENINGMALLLKESQVEMLEKERLDHEMELANQIQQSLLPECSLQAADFECLGSNRAAAEVGGDFYDYFKLADDRIGLVMADVSGKGLGGCLVTSMLAVLLRSLRDQFDSPRELLIALEKEMQPSLGPGTFITIFYSILDPGSGRLTFASAAHSPLLVYRADGHRVDDYKTKGIPLGAMKNGILGKTLQDSTIELAPGDLILQYTDGLNESWNTERQEQFGFERIKEMILKRIDQGSQEYQGNKALLESLESAAEKWARPDEIEDDLTLVVLARSPVSAPIDKAQCCQPSSAATLLGTADLNRDLADAPHLSLPSDLSLLDRIRPWLEDDPALGNLPSELKMIVESSLYEICANIIEHGYGNQPGRKVDLWWVSTQTASAELLNFFPELPVNKSADTDGGYFLVRDAGEPIRPGMWTPPNLHSAACRRKGRGLGLHIVHSSMKDVEQIPGTPEGNLTLLRFDPQQHLTGKETPNV
ncbi:MAG: SpoIIE family protein phosphatase [Gemmatimonadales bacterium]|nr:SpoIIE family protein phosphatase [Gemmatimonadales bacterium]